MLNRGPLNTGPINSAGNVELSIRYNVTARGAAVQYNSFEQDGSGRHGVVIRNYDNIVASGAASLFRQFDGCGGGRYGLGATTYHVELRGVSRWYVNYRVHAAGAAALYRTVNGEIARGAYGISGANYTVEARGGHSLAYESYCAEAVGASVLNGFVSTCIAARGSFVQLQNYTVNGRGLSRIADDTLVQYELYRGVDADPDFNAAPWQTFAAVPFETPALTPGHEYRFVLRQRNAWDLQSKNIDSWSVVVDDLGDIENTPPSSPTEITLNPAAAGAVHIAAKYSYAEDGDAQADQWLIYLTNDGSDPDPATDTPVTVTMRKADGVAKLNYTSSTFSNGATVKALVRARRSVVPIDSTNTAIVSTIASTSGPSAPIGTALFGKIAGQK